MTKPDLLLCAALLFTGGAVGGAFVAWTMAPDMDDLRLTVQQDSLDLAIQARRLNEACLMLGFTPEPCRDVLDQRATVR